MVSDGGVVVTYNGVAAITGLPSAAVAPTFLTWTINFLMPTASVGVTLIERDGVTHVLDIVGREHYPTVASFIDEARRLGVSRRAPRTIDFGRITSASRMLLAHAHADIANAAEFPCDERCPCHVPGHLAAGFAEMCARLWWQEPLEAARHRLALFASFPIPQIEVVKDTAGSHVATSEMASRAGVPVVEVGR